MFRFFVKYQVIIILGVVALMSGILSIVREVLILYFPNQTQERTLFWACVRIAFIVSALLALYGAYQRGEDLQQQLTDTKPKLSGEIYQTAIGPSGVKDENTLMMVIGSIKNTGAPSVIDRMALSVKVDGQWLPTVPIYPPTQTITLSGPDFGNIVLNSSDFLPKKAKTQPIPTGGAAEGFVSGVIEGKTRTEVFKPSTVVKVIFSDVTGKVYEVESSLGSKAKMIDPSTLQRPPNK